MRGDGEGANTITKVNINVENATRMEDNEIWRARSWTRTLLATMTQLVPLAKVFKGDLTEKQSVPFLRVTQ